MKQAHMNQLCQYDYFRVGIYIYIVIVSWADNELEHLLKYMCAL